MKNILSMLALVVLVGLAAPAIAADVAKAQAAATHQLKDGGTLYIFKDGKMAKENKYGWEEVSCEQQRGCKASQPDQ